MPGQRSTGSAEEAKQGAETPSTSRNWSWIEAKVWTKRMLSALGNGVKGGKWYSLIDKVYAPDTLKLAWMKVQANKGAAGVDRQSVDRFAAKAEASRGRLESARGSPSHLARADTRPTHH